MIWRRFAAVQTLLPVAVGMPCAFSHTHSEYIVSPAVKRL
jgi:hypothetical protein